MENPLYHLLTQIVVVVKSPPHLYVPTLGGRFSDVVQQSSPTKPQVVALARHIVEDLEGMVKIILVLAAVAFLNDVKACNLGKYQCQQSAAL